MNKTINMIEIVARLQCMQAELVKLNNQVGSLIEEITSSVKNEDVKTMEQLKANKERAPKYITDTTRKRKRNYAVSRRFKHTYQENIVSEVGSGTELSDTTTKGMDKLTLEIFKEGDVLCNP